MRVLATKTSSFRPGKRKSIRSAMAAWLCRPAHVDMGLTVALDVASLVRWPLQLYLERTLALSPLGALVDPSSHLLHPPSPLTQPFHCSGVLPISSSSSPPKKIRIINFLLLILEDSMGFFFSWVEGSVVDVVFEFW